MSQNLEHSAVMVDDAYCQKVLEQTIELFQRGLQSLQEEDFDAMDSIMTQRKELLAKVQALNLTAPDRVLSENVLELCARVRQLEEELINSIDQVTRDFRQKITEVYGHRQKLSQYNKAVRLLDESVE